MSNNQIDVDKIVTHWISTSDADFQTMLNLFDTKDFHWALFMGHLVIEKLLKGKIVKDTKQHAPFTHDLRKLKRISDLKLDDEKIKWLDTITAFNLNARYDDYKQEFYHKCTKDFAIQWIENIKTLRLWIKERL
jgi:HEPN domain-containing protein